jgi:hypothetical protein
MRVVLQFIKDSNIFRNIKPTNDYYSSGLKKVKKKHRSRGEAAGVDGKRGEEKEKYYFNLVYRNHSSERK